MLLLDTPFKQRTHPSSTPTYSNPAFFQVTAILGAHTLGGAHPEHSGFDGDWVEGQSTSFGKKYYVLLKRGLDRLTFIQKVGVIWVIVQVIV